MSWRAFLRGLGSVFDLGGTGYAQGGEIPPGQFTGDDLADGVHPRPGKGVPFWADADWDRIAGDVDRALGPGRRDGRSPRS